MGLYSNDTLSISQLRLLYPDMQTCLDDEVIDQLTEELSGKTHLDTSVVQTHQVSFPHPVLLV